MARRVWGVARQSRKGDGPSIEVQSAAIRAAVEAEGDVLLGIIVEQDISGASDLVKRKMLRAIEAIEAGEADAILSAYFDRLFRDVDVQNEVVDRIDNAGGEIGSLDGGRISYADPTDWLIAMTKGVQSAYLVRITRKKSGEAQAALVARGIPVQHLPIGLTLAGEKVRVAPGVIDDQRHVVTTDDIDTVRELFRLRDEGWSYARLVGWLAERGIVYKREDSVRRILANRLYVGEIHHGKLQNLTAFPPAVDPDLFARVQDRKAPRGPQPKTESLLGRTGVLCCHACGYVMVKGSSTLAKSGQVRPSYRCAYVHCPKPVAVSAAVADAFVWGETLRILSAEGEEGRASAHATVAQLKAAWKAAKANRDGFVAANDDWTSEAVQAKGRALAEAEKMAKAAYDEARLSVPGDEVVDVASLNDPDITLPERKAAIRLALRKVSVRPGRRGHRGIDRDRFVVDDWATSFQAVA